MPSNHRRRQGKASGCPACLPDDAESAWSARRSLTRLAELVDDSHLHVILLRCPRCGLELASVFSEQIDWCDGNDPQYWCLVPLAPGEAKQLAGAANPDALTSLLATFATDRRVLHRDCPKGGPCGTFWRPGLRVI